MPDLTLKGQFPDIALADSAVGRLEILGIPPLCITTSSTAEGVVVHAIVEGRLVDKARDILRFG